MEFNQSDNSVSSAGIHENHRRVLGIALSLIEEQLFEIESWIMGRQRMGYVYTETNELTTEQIKEIELKIFDLRNNIKILCDIYHFPKRYQDSQNAIRAACYASLEILSNMEPRSLEGYGSVNESLKLNLQSFIKKVSQDFHKITSALEKKKNK